MLFMRLVLAIVNLSAFSNSNILLLNPAKVDVAPCTCNTTPLICDLNCCCDVDCSSNDLASFTQCSNTAAQYSIDPSIDYYNCSNINADKENWFPLLCIHSVTSVLLGKYYLPSGQPSTLSTSEFDAMYKNRALAEYNSRSQYMDDTFMLDRTTSESTQRSKCLGNTQTYTNGSCILTDSNGVLVFPRAILNTKCSYSNAVKYLFNIDTNFCESYLTRDTCISEDHLNPLNYQTRVLASSQATTFVVQPQIEIYSCELTNKFGDNSPSNVVLSQTPISQSDSCAACQKSLKTFIFDRASTNSCSSQPPLNIVYPNVNDDYKSEDFSSCKLIITPNAPIYDSSNQLCKGVVSRLKQIYFWTNSTISRVITRIILNDLQINSYIKQKFELNWHPNDDTAVSQQSVSQFEADLKLNEQRDLSGPEGYLIGKPVLSGKHSNNVLNANLVNSLGTFLSNSDNLCGQNSIKQKLKFGLNTSTTCLIRIERNDFNNCSCLRKLIYNRMNAYFVPSEYVAKLGGKANYSQVNDPNWLEIYRDDVINKWIYASISEDVNSTQTRMCTLMPSALTIWFTYAQTGKINGDPINEILSTYVTYSNSTWQFKCKKNDNDCLTNDFSIEFNAKFVDLTKRDSSLGKCNNATESCINEILWIWSENYDGEDLLYLWTVNLTIVFGICSFLIIYFLLFGFKFTC